MRTLRLTGTALVVAALLAGTAAHADFQAALRDYQAGHYDAAHSQFLALAELGDCSSQFNLGAMARKGQGGPKDAASAVGWLQVAAGNGCEQLVGNRLAALSAGLNPEQSRTAASILARYGPEALHAQGIVNPDFTCRDLTPAAVLNAPAAAKPVIRVDTPSCLIINGRKRTRPRLAVPIPR